MKKTTLVAAIIAAAVYTAVAAVNVAPSREHPGSMDIGFVPQFICIGSDDNYYPDGLNWLVTMIKTKTNPTEAEPVAGTFDGAPARISYYMNTFNSEWYNMVDSTNTNDNFYLGADALKIRQSLRAAMADGNEVGSHTKHHMSECTSPLAYWQKEIDSSLIDLAAMGFATDTICGFRTPFLQYNDSTFQVLDGLTNFKYDCSIESGLDAETDGSNYVWPYTLDNGVFGPDSESTPWNTDTTQVKIGNHPGLWEIPAYCVIVPPALRHQIWLQRIDTVDVVHYDDSENPIDTAKNQIFELDFDTTTGKITGLDYNIWSSPANGGFGMTPEQFLATMKYTLDQRLHGNRAPFAFGIHSNIFYDDQGFIDEAAQMYGSMAVPPRATVAQMRKATEDFIDYALSKKEVRFVTQRDLVKWCENPVPFSAIVANKNTVAMVRQNIAVQTATNKITITGLPSNVKTKVSLYTVSGKQIARTSVTGTSLTWKQDKLAAGTYLVKMTNDSFEHTVSILVK